MRLQDGDIISLEISTPNAWHTTDATVLLVHGLCGCHRSPYMIRLSRKLWKRGIRVIRVNLRGCGSGQGLARNPYHSGSSDDVRAVLEHFLQVTPASQISLIGFSLGGNIVLKLAAELGADGLSYIRKVTAVCPPVDLAACAQLLGQPKNRLYEAHFVKLLCRAVNIRHQFFPDLSHIKLQRHMSLYEFDQCYTAPVCGFLGADDYYSRCSSAPLLPRIQVPCYLLFAQDDPFIDSSVLEQINLPPHVLVWRTKHGGHLGFLGRPGHWGGFQWMDHMLMHWHQVA
ncbi:MAG: alpha/beta fold hydrolase [bacterium]|nr:alpha/beta fold hydrolase [bacterium]